MATAAHKLSSPLLTPDKAKRSAAQWGIIAAGVMFVIGIGYVATRIAHDLSGVHNTSAWPFLLLGLALTIALGFEFVNGFHDTANAVATVIYTHSLEPHMAVLWSGTWNFIGVLLSSGGVAYTIITLLPVELILQVGYGAGFAMVFALLIAAILWNLATWMLGLPASSSHTMIGSIIGVGLANQYLSKTATHTSGVDWSQVTNVFKVLLISPIVGFVFSGLLLLLMKFVIKDPALYEAPKGTEPPPFWIRCMLILTCTGVSFGHGSNDGQKGMGLIMLILIGTVPTAYALNHAVGPNQLPDFIASSERAISVMQHAVVTPDDTASAAPIASAPVQSGTNANVGTVNSMGGEVERFISDRKLSPQTPAAVADLMQKVQQEVTQYKALKNVPPDQQRNVRKRPGCPHFLQGQAGHGHQVHPHLGESCCRTGTRHGHHDRLEADCRYGRREDRQDPPDLRAGHVGRDCRSCHHHHGRPVQDAGFDHARTFIGRGRHHGGQQERPPVEHTAQHCHGLGADAAGCGPAVGQPLLGFPPHLLTSAEI